MNFIHIAGHLGGDPEVRFTSTGKKITTLNVATRSRRGKNNEETTLWWRVTVWGEQFDKMISYLKKGSPVIVHGEVYRSEFTDREGKPHVSYEITATSLEFSPFGKPGGSQAASEGQPGAQSSAGPAAPFGSAPMEAPTSPYSGFSKAGTSIGKGETFDDEVPF